MGRLYFVTIRRPGLGLASGLDTHLDPRRLLHGPQIAVAVVLRPGGSVRASCRVKR